nr:hypothetical protein Iba_scaffold1302585CG0010 [Ipomoea batatas]
MAESGVGSPSGMNVCRTSALYAASSAILKDSASSSLKAQKNPTRNNSDLGSVLLVGVRHRSLETDGWSPRMLIATRQRILSAGSRMWVQKQTGYIQRYNVRFARWVDTCVRTLAYKPLPTIRVDTYVLTSQLMLSWPKWTLMGLTTALLFWIKSVNAPSHLGHLMSPHPFSLI